MLLTVSLRRGTSGRAAADAVVIGAGHNGLTAAAYLARAGLDVLVLERRDIVGGACVTEEIAPGCRASTTSYIASMLRPEVVRDLDLEGRGLRMIPCEPGLQVPFVDGAVLRWWEDPRRTADEIARYDRRDAHTFIDLHARLLAVGARLQPFFLDPPPDITATGISRVRELIGLARRLTGMSAREVADVTTFLTSSLGHFLDNHFRSDHVKTLMLANTVYGKHGGPYQAGTLMGLLFHLLSGGPQQQQGYFGHVMGGMGTITKAMASAAQAFGARILTGAPVGRIDVRGGAVTGVSLEDGTMISAPLVLSNADPKRTFLSLLESDALPDGFRVAVEGIRMDGPAAKVNLVLTEEPRVTSLPADSSPAERSLFTLVDSLQSAERCADEAKLGLLPKDLWIDCVVASNVDASLAPEGRHILSCFVQYLPFHLRGSDWDRERERLGDLVVERIGQFAPNVPGAVVARQTITPLDLERTYGLTEGNIFHGDLAPDQLFYMRPVPGWSRYETPLRGLYLCGAGAHPGGGVTGAPGYCAAHRVLRGARRFRLRGR